MISTEDLPTTDVFLRTLDDSGLLAASQLSRVAAWRKLSPGQGADDLANFLVEQQFLTRFQAATLLESGPTCLTLSSFTIVDKIGTGSMGTVYKARSSTDEGLYALKVVPRRSIINLKSIAEKIEALKQVRHPRVSALVHVGAQGDRAYMAWPLIEGGEKLDAVVKNHEVLTPRQSAQVALQIASGLQAYHAEGLFHGLLKPSDVLIGTDRRVRILDFGVGFLLTCDQGKALLDTMTNSKALARGLDCASPESILDPLHRTVQGDQYSLGCILYYCLSGRFPFDDANPVRKMLAHQTQEPTPIQKLAEDCPPRLATIVHRLLSKLPEDRYDATEELVADLQKITAGSKHGSAQGLRPSSQGISFHGVPKPAQSAVEQPSPPPPEVTIEPESKTGLWLTIIGAAAGCIGGLVAWTLLNN